jgi:hypothetical protein
LVAVVAVVALPAVPAVAAFKFATWVVLATVNGAVPVVTVDVITPDAEIVVKAPVDAVVTPIAVPSIAPPVTATEFAFCVDMVPKPVMSVLGIVEEAVSADVPVPLT